MRATLNIPDSLIDEVFKAAGTRTKTAAIVTALESYVREKKKHQLLALRGRTDLAFDWEASERDELAQQSERERTIDRR